MKLKTEVNIFLKKYEKNYFGKTLFPYWKVPKSLVNDYYEIRKKAKRNEKCRYINLPGGMWILRKYSLEVAWILLSIFWVLTLIFLFSLFKGIIIILVSTIMIFLWLLKLYSHKIYRAVYRKLNDVKNALTIKS